MGALSGFRVIELAGLGPCPHAAMMLADMGADVIRVDRTSDVARVDAPGAPTGFFDRLRDDLSDAEPGDAAGRTELFHRGRRSIALDLKSADGLEVLLELVTTADALIEGFRPGTAERLGFGPDVCAARNPKLVFGRMTGWGQSGPYAPAAGHDINYIALAGVLAHLGRADAKPTPPINLVGDFAGGAMFLAFGVVCALIEAQRSGTGQVIDAAMVDGAASLMTMMWAAKAVGQWNDDRGTNVLDSAAHFYDTYECSDGRYVAVGAIEPAFYNELLRLTDLAPDAELPPQMDGASWPKMKTRLAAAFATRTRDEWATIFEGTDGCVTPVLTMDEAAAHPHNVGRATFIEIDGIVQPAPVPRLERTPGAVQRPPAQPGEHTDDVLADWLSWSSDRTAVLRRIGAIA